LNVGCDHIRLIQFADHDTAWAFDYKDWRGVARQVLRDYDGPIVCHNTLYDSKMLLADGLDLPQRLAHDTMIMAHLKNPAARMDLKGAATIYVDRRAQAGRGALEQAMAAGGWDWATVPLDLPAYWMYGAMDTLLTARLASTLWPEVATSYREAYELELAVIHCLRRAEVTGMAIDEDYRLRACAHLEREIDELRAHIPCTNPGSDRQVIELLHAQGARWDFRTERGNLSTDKEVLRWLAERGFPVAALIEQYRSKTRMLTGYLYKIADVSQGGLAVGGAVRASTRPVGARTGRMSVTDPPLQTLPRGRVVRDAFVARPGHRLLLADFAGMEMRALASDAREANMLAAYARGEDLHNFVASAAYGPDFTKKQRQVCKNAGFAKIYGAGVEKFAVTAGIEVADAASFLARYDELFPGVSSYQQAVVSRVMERAGGDRKGYGYVTLIDGRRLPVEAAKAYVAVNYRIQGSTAVATKRKIAELDAAGMGPFFRLAVHDELIYEVPDEHVPAAREVIRRVMPDTRSFPGVTLEIEQDEVSRWGEHYRGDEYPAYLPTEPAPWLAEAA
jgi:DNA polymerase-1